MQEVQKKSDKKQKEYKELLKRYHRHSERHVLVLEANLSHADKCKIFHCADLERKAGNELIAIMQNNYEQLSRTKKYRKLKKIYGKCVANKNKKEKKKIALQLKNLQK